MRSSLQADPRGVRLCSCTQALGPDALRIRNADLHPAMAPFPHRSGAGARIRPRRTWEKRHVDCPSPLARKRENKFSGRTKLPNGGAATSCMQQMSHLLLPVRPEIRSQAVPASRRAATWLPKTHVLECLKLAW